MKLNNVTNIEGMFSVIDKCKGKVELISDEGDRINLKSKLSQYVSFAKIMASGNEIPELEIVAYELDDINLLMQFMYNGSAQK